MSSQNPELMFFVQTAAATATVGNSMATASAAMASVGQAADPAKMQQTMQQVPLLLLVLFLIQPLFIRYLCDNVCATHCLPYVYEFSSQTCMQRDSGTFLNSTSTHIMLRIPIIHYSCCANIFSCMLQFAKENAKMDMASEMMGDAVDDALDDDEVEDETDDLMNQVCFCSFTFVQHVSPNHCLL